MRKRNIFRRVKCLLALTLAFLVAAVSAKPVRTAFAADGGYTYTIRIFAGNQGKISGGEVKVYSGLSYGSRVSFQQRDVTLNDNSKYYIRGIRESGKDNNTVSNLSTITVTGDLDYVVAYGILGSSVAYTVNYVDANGNTLAPQETYYGNVGDRPVIAFLYIDGYFPNAYNLTRTLSENAAENVFTFTYSPLVPETTAATPTTPAPVNPTSPAPVNPTSPATTTTAAATTPTTAANPAAPTTTAAAAEQPATPEQPAQPTQAAVAEQPATPEQPTQPTTAAPQPTTAAPQPTTQAAATLPQSPDEIPDLVNLDEPNVPLANFDESQSAEETSAAAESGAEETSAVGTTSETVEVNNSNTPLGGFVSGIKEFAKDQPLAAGGVAVVALALAGALIFGRKRR